MNKLELQKFIQDQILVEQNLFLESQALTEAQRSDKIVYILCESDSSDEENFFDKIKRFYGGTKRSIKKFLIRRLLGYMGIRMRSVIREPLVGVLEDFSFQDIQGVFRGNDEIQRKMAEVSSQAVLDTLKQTVYKQIGVRDNSFLGEPVLQAIETVFERQDFKEMLHQTFIEALVNVSAAIEAREAPDIDGDGLDGSEEAIMGTDPTEPGLEAEVEIDDDEEDIFMRRFRRSIDDMLADPKPATPDPEAEVEIDDEEREEPPTERDTDEGKRWTLYWKEGDKLINGHPDFFEEGRVSLDDRRGVEDKIRDYKERSNYVGPYYILAWQRGEDGEYNESGGIMPMEEHPDWSTGASPSQEEEPSVATAEVEVDDEELEEPQPQPQPVPTRDAGKPKKEQKKQIQNELKDFARSALNGKLGAGSRKTKNFVPFVKYLEGNLDKLQSYLDIVAQDISTEEKMSKLHEAGYVTDAGIGFFRNLSNTAEENVSKAQTSEDAEETVAAASAAVEDPDASEDQKETASREGAEAVEDAEETQPEPQEEEEKLDPEEVIDLETEDASEEAEEKTPEPEKSSSPGRPRDASVSELRDDIVRTLQDADEPLRINDIAKRMGIMGGVDVLKSELEKMDQVVSQGGKYRIKTEEDAPTTELREIYPFREHIGMNSGKDESVLERELKRIMLKAVRNDGTIDREKIRTISKPLERDLRKARIVADIINYMSEEEEYEGRVPDDEEDLMMMPSTYLEELINFVLSITRGSSELNEEFYISNEMLEKLLS